MTASTDRPGRPLARPGKQQPGGDVGGTPVGARATPNDDEEKWRHEPVAPIDEGNPLRSLGEAVGDTITGSGADKAKPTPAPTTTPARAKGR